MAFTDPITLADSSAANQSFTVKSSGVDSRYYIENDAALTDQRYLSIRHSDAGKVNGNALPLRRHNVTLGRNKLNTTTGKNEKFTSNFTFVVDPQANFTETDCLDIVTMLKNFITSTNFSKLLRDET